MAVPGPEATRLLTGPSFDDVLEQLVFDAEGPRDFEPQPVRVDDEAA